jgi:hypothetical protein
VSPSAGTGQSATVHPSASRDVPPCSPDEVMEQPASAAAQRWLMHEATGSYVRDVEAGHANVHLWVHITRAMRSSTVKCYCVMLLPSRLSGYAIAARVVSLFLVAVYTLCAYQDDNHATACNLRRAHAGQNSRATAEGQ